MSLMITSSGRLPYWNENLSVTQQGYQNMYEVYIPTPKALQVCLSSYLVPWRSPQSLNSLAWWTNRCKRISMREADVRNFFE